MKYNEINLPNRSVRYRAFVVSIILIPINIYWNVQMELVRYSGLPTTISLFFNVIFNLLVLSLANIEIKHLFIKTLFKSGELSIIYVMLSIISEISYNDKMQLIILRNQFR